MEIGLRYYMTKSLDNIYTVVACKIKSGLLIGTFKTREAVPMMKMFNSYIRSIMEYCSLTLNPLKKEESDRIEIIQKNFTCKNSGLEEIKYPERLKKLGFYNLERRRESFLIINVWQQFDIIKENL